MAPRNLVNAETISKAYGPRLLLDRVSLGVADGQRIGVVGRNGDGKSTLLSILAGTTPADSGRVTRTSGLTVGLLSQTDDLQPSRTVSDVVVGERPDHVWAGISRIREAVEALLVDLPFDAPVGGLSGGERRRVALAGLLVADPDLLFLDEPTNHLDVEVVAWLAEHLSARRGSLVVVTHDRWFLDAVADRTWDVADATVHEYEGGYAAYVLARAERSRIADAEQARRNNLMRKELAWLRRGPPARTSKPRFRIDAAQALIADEPPARDAVELVGFATTRLGRSVYDVEDACVSLGDRSLFRGLTWRIGPGDRFGIVGVNGSGKTSLLRMLAGELRPSQGRVRIGQTVRVGYLTQDAVELDPDLRVLETVEAVRGSVDLGRGRTMTAASLVERLGFTGDRAWTRVGELSGGERRRLQLARLLMDEPNVLLLDEPSNDLDIETLTALEDLLDGFAGTIVLVSHDRYVLERICDRVFGLLGDGAVRDLPGGVDEYLQLRARQGPATALPRPQSAGSVARQQRTSRKDLARVDRRLQRLESDEARLHERMLEVASDHEQVLALDVELRVLRDDRAALEEEWLRLATETDGEIP